jgi:hypothetical protein
MRNTTNRWLVAGAFLAGVLATSALAGQPKMEAALVSLRQARESLREANADKGGHRQKALDLIDAAIGQVQAGIEYSRKND